jgi:hypothetical protein
MVINNGVGNKIDYYLKRRLSYRAGDCDGTTRRSTITAQLTNTAPRSGLVPYVAGTRRVTPKRFAFVPGLDVSIVAMYLTPGARVRSATVGGKPLQATYETVRRHPVALSTVAIKPGQTVTLTYHLTEPTRPGKATVPVQPFVLDQHTTVHVPTCG